MTPAQGLAAHLPALQEKPVSQVIPAQGSGGTQDLWQLKPAAQVALQGLISWHWPSLLEQYFPAEQITPLQGMRKHPSTQCPSTHVCPAGQLVSSQGSESGTQLALQDSPAAQVLLAHGFSLQ